MKAIDRFLELINAHQTVISEIGDNLIRLENKLKAIDMMLVNHQQKINELWLGRKQNGKNRNI
jgi:frataxin-like iron-binding protein CyaY